MPRRNYLVYFDSNVLSTAADPRRDKHDPECRNLIDQAAEFCTLVYSQTVIAECGPERSAEPKLALRRLALLRGANKRKLAVHNTAVMRRAIDLLDRAGLHGEVHTSALFRDAMHLASAILGGVHLFVTSNMKDFRRLCQAKGDGPVWSDGVRVVRPEFASSLISENPPLKHKRVKLIRGMVPTTAELYARRQYWSMRDWGYSPKEAQAYIKRKWTITVREPRRASA